MNNWTYFWFMISIFFIVTGWVGSAALGIYREGQSPSDHH